MICFVLVTLLYFNTLCLSLMYFNAIALEPFPLIKLQFVPEPISTEQGIFIVFELYILQVRRHNLIGHSFNC